MTSFLQKQIEKEYDFEGVTYNLEFFASAILYTHSGDYWNPPEYEFEVTKITDFVCKKWSDKKNDFVGIKDQTTRTSLINLMYEELIEEDFE